MWGGYGGITYVGMDPGVYTVNVCLDHALYGVPGDEIKGSKKVTLTASVRGTEVIVDVPLPVYDITVGLLTSFGDPVKGARLSVGGVWVGVTDENGNVAVTGIPNGTFRLVATLYAADISPSSQLVVKGNDVYRFTARMAVLTVRVATQMGQGISGAGVTLRTNLTVVFSGRTNSNGEMTCCLPLGVFYASVVYKGYDMSKTIYLTSDATELVVAPFFVEISGMTLDATNVAVLAVVILLGVAALFYFLKHRRGRGQTPIYLPDEGDIGRASSAGFVLCPSCGGKNEPTDRFCGQCGGLLPPVRADDGKERSIQSQHPARPRLAPVPSGLGVKSIPFFFLGALAAILVHESIHIMFIEHFGGIIMSLRIFGFVVAVSSVFTFVGWNWTGDIADVEGFFPVLPSQSDLWLAHWMPEVIGLISVVVILTILIKWGIDDPGVFSFLAGVLLVSTFGLAAIAMSLI